MPRTLTYSIVTTTVLILGITLSILSTPVHAQTQGEVCNLYTPSVTTPTGYGASYNVFNQSELMLSIYCNEDKSVTVTAGNNDPLTYVYNQGYYYANNQWNNFTYTCTDETIADIWCTKQATKTLTSTPTSGITYLVSYTCQWRNNTWNCGCHNSACTTNHWQLQGWTVQSSGVVGDVTNIDFESSQLGSYTTADVDKDFRAKTVQSNNGIISVSGNNSDTRIVSDPDGTQGNVLRSTYRANTTRGRLQWRDFFSRTNEHLKPISGSRVSSYPKSAWVEDPENNGSYPAGRPPGEPGEQAQQREQDPSQVRLDEVYFSVDMRLDDNWVPLPMHKLWGVKEGSPTQSAHGPYLCPHEEGYYGLSLSVNLQGREWGERSNGAMAMYLYETDRTQQTLWLNRNNPNVIRRDAMGPSDYYFPPKGQWITVEVRSKLNTADKVWKGINDTTGSCRHSKVAPSQDLSNGARDDAPSAGDKADGVLQVWVTDPRPVSQGGTGGKPQLMFNKQDVMQRWWSYLKYGHFLMRDWNNYDTRTNQYLPQHDQNIYFDNIRVSTDPITH